MTTVPTLLALEKIEVVYGEGSASTRALVGVSLTLSPGEVVALIGPSGSGKTSLLQIMGLLLLPTRGRVLLRGEPVNVDRPRVASRLRRENYGFVFQGYNLFPTLTAAENVRLAFSIKGDVSGDVSARAANLLEWVGLDGLADRYPRQLSGGQKQRVAIARSLAADPAILLADEPTAALDTDSGEQIMALLASLASEQRAVVIVSHDPRVTAHVQRTIGLRDGGLHI